MGEVESLLPPLDDKGRPVISEADKARVSALWTTIPEGKKGALLVIADLDGSARMQVASRLGGSWKVGAGVGWKLDEKRPSGYIGIEGSW